MNGLYISQFLSLEKGKWVIKKQNCVSKELNGVHYLLDNSVCKAIIIGDQDRLTQRIHVEETVDIDGKSYPVDTIWLTYTHCDFYNTTSCKIHLKIPKSIKVVEHITKETLGEKCKEKMRVWFEVDEQNPYFSSNNDYCLYNKDKTVLLHYGGDVEKYEAPDSLISIDTKAFIGIDKNPKVIIFPRGFVKLENKTLCRYCSELHFQGQINHIDAGALDSFNGTIKMNGLLSLIDDEGRNEIKRWYNERSRDNKRELVLKAPGPMGGKYEDGVITLTKVLRLEEKLACGCDTLPVHFNVNKFFIDGNNISVPMIVDTVVIGGEHTYRPGIYSPLYTEIEVTRIQFVCKTENHDNVLFEILVHESEDEVIELIKKSNKCID